MSQQFTPEYFRDWLRKIALEMASGEREEHFFPDAEWYKCSDPSFPQKATANYIRNTMMRCASLAAIGTVSIKKGEDIYQRPGITISLKRGVSRKEARRVSEVDKQIRDKLVDRIVRMSPALEEFTGDEKVGAEKAITIYKDMIREIKYNG